MKKYLKTFKWKGGSFNDKARVIGFLLFTVIFTVLGLLVLNFHHIENPDLNILGNPIFNLFISSIFGILITFIIDQVEGLGRIPPWEIKAESKKDRKLLSNINKKIAIGCDHGGYKVKEHIV